MSQTTAERAREFVETGFRSLGVPSLEPYIQIITELLDGAVEAERERCARLVEGDGYKEHYRKWPCIGDGDRGDDSDLVKHFLDPLAAAIRRGVAHTTGK